MLALRYYHKILPLLFVLVILAGLVAGCNAQNDSEQPGLRTWLLVRPPDTPLQVNQPVNVRSRTQDTGSRISHIELYAVKLPSGEQDVLIRSDPAPFDQTTYTASQIFIPTQTGSYVIKVVGYNREGEWAESDYIGFDVK
jgi:hypothetical protein